MQDVAWWAREIGTWFRGFIEALWLPCDCFSLQWGGNCLTGQSWSKLSSCARAVPVSRSRRLKRVAGNLNLCYTAS